MTGFNFIGVDVAKDKFDISFYNGKRRAHHVFSNNESGFSSLLKKTQSNPLSPWVCMEATGIYSEGLAEYLVGKGVRTSVVNPLQIKYFAKSILSRNKNDKVDSETIAAYVEKQEPEQYKPKTKVQKEMRELLQVIDMLSKQSTECKNKLHAARTSPAKQVLKQMIFSFEKKKQKLMGKVAGLVELDQNIKQAVQLICSIKGVAEGTAYRLLAYLPDIKGFSSAKQLAAYIGVSPRQSESGLHKGETHMSKLGEAHIRKALYMPAMSAKRNNTYLKPFISRLEKNGLKPKAIVGAIMRKLVHLIFGILKSGKAFDPKLV
mgnify:CR=1 FL=1